jgi:hypothetical protein
MARSMNQRWRLPTAQKTLYPSYSHWDDLTWAAAWLCRANSSFCAEALNSYDVAYQQAGYEVEMTYNNLMPHASMLLMSMGIAGAKRVETFNDVVTQVLSHWMVRGRMAASPAPWRPPRGGGLPYRAGLLLQLLAAQQHTGNAGEMVLTGPGCPG